MLLICGILGSSPSLAEWQPHNVRQLKGKADERQLSAQRQIVTENWNELVRAPYLVYMPEKDRLAMLVNRGAPLNAALITSDDRGRTWTPPQWTHTNDQGKPDSGVKTGLTYLGNGKLLYVYDTRSRWCSEDYGRIWKRLPPAKERFDVWDPVLVDRDVKTGRVVRLAEAAYRATGELSWGKYRPEDKGVFDQTYIRFSIDEGRSWGQTVKVPQWRGVNEVALARAKNGDIVAACRTDLPKRFRAWFGRRTGMDHYTGLAVSVSRDNGHTWSPLNRLYDWGRHHPSMVVMPKGDVVMSYVVRRGYVDTPEGFTQFGIEAVVSHDDGRTWDLDHRYILDCWAAPIKGENSWSGGCQGTSSVLVPDGWILTAYGTGYRAKYPPSGRPGHPTPRDIGLVRWRPSSEPVDSDRRIRDAAFDSDVRNVFDPTPDRSAKLDKR